MKTIAFYLPQFHAIPENDEWWGKGFTEWVNVKASKPQFCGHIQPEVPLGNDYYNLLDSAAQVKQAKTAKQYGIDGFCYYHYWFEGKLLLEKPMENMLANPEVDIPFCVCWANETWARTWDGRETHVLIKQNYNEDYTAWKAHFDYLLPFFKDSRYICHENKPMMLLYKPHLITNCQEMIRYWNELAQQAGFDGMYFGYQHFSAFDADCEALGFDFGVEFEPFYTVRELKKEIASKGKLAYALGNPGWLFGKLKQKVLRTPIIYNYENIWKRIVKRMPEKANLMPGAFTAWDNTPRRGNNANVFHPATPAIFRRYFSQRVRAAKEVYNAPYLFINAWNEWAEGAHLEPDEVNGYGYLEAVQAVLSQK